MIATPMIKCPLLVSKIGFGHNLCRRLLDKKASSYSLTNEDMMSSKLSRQIDSGDHLELLEQVVESIALQLDLFVDDDEASIPVVNRKSNMGDVHQNVGIIGFQMTLSRKDRIHSGNANLLPLISMSLRKTLDLQVNSRKLTEIMMMMMDSQLIVKLSLDLQRRTLKDGMYKTLYTPCRKSCQDTCRILKRSPQDPGMFMCRILLKILQKVSGSCAGSYRILAGSHRILDKQDPMYRFL